MTQQDITTYEGGVCVDVVDNVVSHVIVTYCQVSKSATEQMARWLFSLRYITAMATIAQPWSSNQ